VWHIIPSFGFLIKRWEMMATQSQYQGLQEALSEGIKSLYKWYGQVEGLPFLVTTTIAEAFAPAW
jgi:hypothetical protein